MNLSDQIFDIYISIKPTLRKIALARRVPSPEQFVDQWLSSAYIIAKRFDNGDLKKKNRDEKTGHLVLLEEKDQIKFLRSFSAYLLKSFSNSAIIEKKWYSRNIISDKIIEPNRVLSSDLLCSQSDDLEGLIKLLDREIKRDSNLNNGTGKFFERRAFFMKTNLEQLQKIKDGSCDEGLDFIVFENKGGQRVVGTKLRAYLKEKIWPIYISQSENCLDVEEKAYFELMGGIKPGAKDFDFRSLEKKIKRLYDRLLSYKWTEDENRR